MGTLQLSPGMDWLGSWPAAPGSFTSEEKESLTSSWKGTEQAQAQLALTTSGLGLLEAGRQQPEARLLGRVSQDFHASPVWSPWGSVLSLQAGPCPLLPPAACGRNPRIGSVLGFPCSRLLCFSLLPGLRSFLWCSLKEAEMTLSTVLGVCSTVGDWPLFH